MGNREHVNQIVHILFIEIESYKLWNESLLSFKIIINKNKKTKIGFSFFTKHKRTEEKKEFHFRKKITIKTPHWNLIIYSDMLLKEENNDVNVQNTEKRQYAVDGLFEAKENKIIINLYNTIEHAKRNLELNQYKK